MEAKLFNSLITKAPLFPIKLTPSKRLLPSKPFSLRLLQPAGSSGNANANTNEDTDAAPPRLGEPQITPPPETVEVRFRRRPSKKRGGTRRGGDRAPTAVKEEKVKKWEDMSLGEKAIELYVGEKGALYWLNKFAYASIFIVIGAWILFRFVGPALNLYQLDAPPLSPEAVLKGS